MPPSWPHCQERLVPAQQGLRCQHGHLIDPIWQLHNNYFVLLSSLFCCPKFFHNNTNKLKFEKGNLRFSRHLSNTPQCRHDNREGPHTCLTQGYCVSCHLLQGVLLTSLVPKQPDHLGMTSLWHISGPVIQLCPA